MKITDDGIVYFGDEPEQGVFDQARMHLVDKRCVKVCLAADNHFGYSMAVGGIAAYRNAVSPSAVGYDLCCGNKAVLLDANANTVRENIKNIMDEVASQISFGVGRANNEKVDHDLFDDPTWKLPFFKEIDKDVKGSQTLKGLAKEQLGTVGSGNHYILIATDELDRVWVGCHFGSRGMGHKIATYFLKLVGGKDDMMAFPTVFDVNSEIGQNYLSALALASRYAYAGRDWVCSKVARILNAKELESVHNHHNNAWQEEHFGEKLWVVRKGATPAFPGQKGFVGGSMGDNSVIIEGVDSENSKTALYSTVHGAGRVMGRMEAKGKFKKRTAEDGSVSYECTREPKVKTEDMMKWINDFGVELRGGGVDESPFVYKRLHEVLKHHEGTIKILHQLKPIGTAMAGKDIRDPYQD